MRIIKSISEMCETSSFFRLQGKRIGFVPTMGYLHEGHLSLIRIAKKESDVVVVSNFVNPAQFGPSEDLEKYPKDFNRDEQLCNKEGVDIVFYPESADMYDDHHSVYVVEKELSKGLCGAKRPGHFDGVCTIVMKLFNIIQPNIAIFGQKDAQQLCIIKKMVKDLNIPVVIKEGPIIREKDGLAMSSRNSYLSDRERMDAICIYKSLQLADKMIREGERDICVIKNAIKDILSQLPSISIDYIEMVDCESLQEIAFIDRKILIVLAVYVGSTRLIDNIMITV
jgi:pantoate--beta-alanine ligase